MSKKKLHGYKQQQADRQEIKTGQEPKLTFNPCNVSNYYTKIPKSCDGKKGVCVRRMCHRCNYGGPKELSLVFIVSEHVENF